MSTTWTVTEPLATAFYGNSGTVTFIVQNGTPGLSYISSSTSTNLNGILLGDGNLVTTVQIGSGLSLASGTLSASVYIPAFTLANAGQVLGVVNVNGTATLQWVDISGSGGSSYLLDFSQIINSGYYGSIV